MKRILLLSQFFYPDKTGTGKILAELFFALNKQKFSVDVISSRQKYSDVENCILKKQECIDGIHIYRTFRWFMSKEQPLGRIYNYMVFFLCACVTCFFKRLHKAKDIIVSVSNPPIMPLLGALLRSENRKFIYILHDLYPDIAIAMHVVDERHLFSRMMFKVNQYVFRRADKIVVLGRDMKLHLMRAYSVPEKKLVVITNWANIKQQNANLLKKKSKFRILYTGNMGRFHNLEVAVETVRNRSDVELFFVGEGALKSKLMEMSIGMGNVKFFPYLDDEEYSAMLGSTDALLVSLEKNLSGLAVPSKFYTYLAAGKPIFCISDKDTEMAITIEEYKCGFVIAHEDVAGFRKAIDDLLQSKELKGYMGENGRKLFEEKYRKDHIVKQYEKLFDDII